MSHWLSPFYFAVTARYFDVIQSLGCWSPTYGGVKDRSEASLSRYQPSAQIDTVMYFTMNIGCFQVYYDMVRRIAD
jgi:hypothetical protein